MKKSIGLLSVLLVVVGLSTYNVASASTNKELNLNVNGQKVAGQGPIIINNNTLVPIRTVSLIPSLKVDWDNTTKTVTVIDSMTKDVVKLKVGSKTAYIGDKQVTLATPAIVKEGLTYVPFRFIGEGLKAHVEWDSNTNTLIIYKPDEELSQLVTGSDITDARNGLIKLPRILLHDGLLPLEDGGAGGTYYFEFGQKNAFIYIYRGLAQYYELKNGAAWQTWEAQVGSQDNNNKDVIPNVISSIKGEWGTRPLFTGKINYFMDLWMLDQVKYGTFDESGKSIFEDSKSINNRSESIIFEIPNES
ncbi:copper amine oxidase N-terminal domain-containing protein [Paenibacillus macquariensis]|uniref:Copper amine oxidase N-terminal domain-containing protein n=1 Tax=Paenibacillus macquariensis TaxID=948756 RepID=A0ABY1JMF4_9BACL|nr:copper amine oxidase N-terminal domain-containing protein [Paenibacillus macquariensis]MEC0092325.1 copper amine oxidase N-terminal domain-containing protein [Paenibacillus macquariensis]OAB37136.1 hypothetical protein PMSM_03395 [Paenibacillus macquariensis subsp. macquariensis]SIQ46153.1 Copper amine oxidase N-terminal domain-containing protein [Paenibacillus macquariensis]